MCQKASATARFTLRAASGAPGPSKRLPRCNKPLSASHSVKSTTGPLPSPPSPRPSAPTDVAFAPARQLQSRNRLPPDGRDALLFVRKRALAWVGLVRMLPRPAPLAAPPFQLLLCFVPLRVGPSVAPGAVVDTGVADAPQKISSTFFRILATLLKAMGSDTKTASFPNPVSRPGGPHGPGSGPTCRSAAETRRAACAAKVHVPACPTSKEVDQAKWGKAFPPGGPQAKRQCTGALPKRATVHQALFKDYNKQSPSNRLQVLQERRRRILQHICAVP